MTKTIGRIDRTGVVHIGNATLSIWEEGIPSPHAAGGHKARDAWEAKFKKDVFTRVIQTLNRIGWTVEQPAIKPHDVKHYGGTVARWATERHRDCSKGDLKGELSISGRCIDFKMWQGVNTPTRPDNGGRHESNKEAVAPYLLRIEMDRTRRRITEYLCNVFTGYTVRPREPRLGIMGVTATEMSAHRRRTSGHYEPELDRAEISMPSNAKARDGGTIEHGAKVWALDHKGRIITGTAYYGLNNRWDVVSGRYGLINVGTSEIFTRQPEFLRAKRNDMARRTTLERKMQAAAKAMDFRRAQVIKDVLFPEGPLFAIWSKSNQAYFGTMYSGYAPNLEAAGKYTRAELKPYLGAALETDDYRAVWIEPPCTDTPF